MCMCHFLQLSSAITKCFSNYCFVNRKNFFKDAGEVVDVRFATDRETGDFKGFGHVEFATVEAAQNVC